MADNKAPTGRGKRDAADLTTAPQYRTTKRVYLNGDFAEAGTTVRFLGVPGSNLIPLDAEGKKIKAKAAEIRKAKYDGDDAGQRHQAMLEALRAYDDELRGIGDFAEAKDDTLSDAERAPLIKAANQTAADTKAAQEADSNFTKVKLQGEANPAPNELQGKPATDTKK